MPGVNKELILENLGKLEKTIDHLRSENDHLEEELASEKERGAHLCWWDAKPCARCSELHGLQGAGSFCEGCGRIDADYLLIVLKEAIPSFLKKEIEVKESEIKKLKEDAESEAGEELEEVLQEINKKVIAITEDEEE